MGFYNDTWQFYQDALSQWRWRLVAGNNTVIGASTEGYWNRTDCIANARRLGYTGLS